jgi:dethiobiotin synthetase
MTHHTAAPNAQRLTPNPHGLFVTGTDTGVGKTLVAAGLAAALRRRGIDAGVMKPVQTGALRTAAGLVGPDTRLLIAASGVDDPPGLVSPVLLEAAVAPLTAAREAGVAIDLRAVMAAYETLRARHGFVVVEGAGGICVPIREGYLMADLAREMGLPLLIVARAGLGTINHTLLTVHYARALGLDTAVLINNAPADPGLAERTAAAVIGEAGAVPVLGELPHDPRLACDPPSLAAIRGLVPDALLDRTMEWIDSAPGLR